MRLLRTIFLASWFLLCGTAALRAQDVLAVMSSESPYYEEALQGLQEALGRKIPAYRASETIYFPDETRVVIAFGRRAALLDYPDDVTLIYCMSPGTTVMRESGRAVKISMFPNPDALAARVKELQPQLGKIAFLHVSIFEIQPYIKAAFAKLGVEVIDAKMPDARGLPDTLRSLLGKVDAILVTPDPLLVSHQNLAILKQFSQQNRVPYYAVTGALVEKGATAAVAISFRDIGKTTARIAQRVLAGQTAGAFIPQDSHEVILSESALSAVGLSLPDELRKRATLLP